jgi:hypothetical protein
VAPALHRQVTARDPAHSHQRRNAVDTRIIREPRPKVPPEKRLALLEERYRHELMNDEGRQELRDRVLALRRRFTERS